MFFTAVKRVTVFALQNFWRNFWLSVATITIMVLSLFSISLLGVLTTLSNEALARLQEKIDITVALKPDLKEADYKAAKTDVEIISGVKSVDLVTPAEALASFRAKHETDSLITESLLELGKNPLGASLVIKAYSDEGYSTILRELATPRFTSVIQDARFEDYRRVIDEVAKFSAKLKSVGAGVSLLFLLITLLVVFNTIRINIYTHREEIGIMRLVGATSWFIRAPFWVESALYAALATLLTAALFFPLLSAIQPYVSSFFNGYHFDLVQYFSQRSLWFFGLQFVGATILSILASTFAMRKYLRV